MTNDSHKSSDEIERDIERERQRLTDNIEDLQKAFSPETIIREIGNKFSDHGGDIGRSIAQSAKANPIALTLTGVGLAWLMWGGQNRENDHSGSDNERRERGSDDRSSWNAASVESRVGSRRPSTNFGETAWAISDRGLHHRDGDDHGSDDHDEGKSVGVRVTDAKDSAAHAVGETGRKVRDAASKGSQSIKDAGARTSKTLQSGVTATQERIDTLYQRISSGTEDLSDAARARVISARRDALMAREKVRVQASAQARNATELYNQQPLVAGALAVAVGAAIGAAIPRSKLEDDLMGEQSDALFNEAERIYRAERDKAERVAKATVEEAKTVAEEMKQELDDSAPSDSSAAQAVGAKVKKAAKRVTDKATTAAVQEGLANPRTKVT